MLTASRSSLPTLLLGKEPVGVTVPRGLVSGHPSSPTCGLPESESRAVLFADDGCGQGLVRTPWRSCKGKFFWARCERAPRM